MGALAGNAKTWDKIMGRAVFLGILLAGGLALSAFGDARAAERKPGDTFKDCGVCPELVAVPAGAFIMGADSRYKYERPAHRVTIARPFAVGKYEVTFDQWDACVDAGGCGHKPDDHKWGRGRRPVINVTVAQVREYLAWISKKTGETYRLPSDAEWEYVARAGTTTQFWWGDKVGVNRANCRNCKSEWSKKKSAPAGSFDPNPWGLYDTAGNVWEWIEDCWNVTHEGAPADASARKTGDCRQNVMRGGSWYYISKNSRSSWRFKNDARVKSYGIGFRVIRELP